MCPLMRLLLPALLLLTLPLKAEPPGDMVNFEQPQQRQMYDTLVAELRCLVCQNQNLADSNAELAVQLKGKVEGMIREGKTKEEIKAYMVARYGDFVLYRPPLKWHTLLLWFGPFILLLLAILFSRKVILNSRSQSPAQMDEAARTKVQGLLHDDHPPTS